MKRLLFILPFVLASCSPKIVYVPTEVVRTEKVVAHDTFIDFKLAPSFDSIATFDTLSIIDRKTAKTTAKISRGRLYHTLEVKDIPIRVEFKYITKEKHDTTTKVIKTELSKKQQYILDNFDKVKESNKNKSETIWKLIGIIGILVLWIFRKPIIALLKL